MRLTFEVTVSVPESFFSDVSAIPGCSDVWMVGGDGLCVVTSPLQPAPTALTPALATHHPAEEAHTAPWDFSGTCPAHRTVGIRMLRLDAAQVMATLHSGASDGHSRVLLPLCM